MIPQLPCGKLFLLNPLIPAGVNNLFSYFWPVKTSVPCESKIPQRHSYLLHAVAPRPIAFASTIDKAGNPNLAPFSFFNVFSSNPPIAIFSPALSGRTGKSKNTHDNVKEVPEVVINVVNYAMVHQMSLASAEYPKGVDEFVKAGFTKIPSERVKPFRVKESPVQMECKVKEVVELGTHGGAGNLIICEIVLIHISESVLDDQGMIDQEKIDLVSRAGANWYCRASGDALFQIAKPLTTLGIGIDRLPDEIRLSPFLSGNHLGKLGNMENIPGSEEIETFKSSLLFKQISEGKNKEKIHSFASVLLDEGRVDEAALLLFSNL